MMMNVTGKQILSIVGLVQKTPYPQILKELLEESGKSRSELYGYLFHNGYIIEKTSMYHYFNSRNMRIPDEIFLHHFADFLGLDEDEREALILMKKLIGVARIA